MAHRNDPAQAVEIRVCGTVQGVGFRPAVWRLAHESCLSGEVRNDAAGVLIKVVGHADAISRFLQRLQAEAPPLSHIEAIDIQRLDTPCDFQEFRIEDSIDGENRTRVTPDAAMCPACREEVLSRLERRYRYPFTNCTHCGPRLSIVHAVPYDRAHTTMAAFSMCEACAAEYSDPADRRFHAQPIACPACGPQAWLERPDGQTLAAGQHGMPNDLPNDLIDDVERAAALIQQGAIVAIRGLGGFHLACDATHTDAVQRLRTRKRRYGKPFALMARDVEMIRRYCTITDTEQRLLQSPEAPIVLLPADGPERLPEAVAPGLATLGFMLPYTPLHLLIVKQIDRPVVMTSGNLSDEPQIISNDEARTQLNDIADTLLLHNRGIANRMDDSVVRVVNGQPRLMRRARGYAPSAMPLPPGFEKAPDLLAYGGELKSTFCLVKNGAAIVSQHQGDLEDVATFEDYQKNLQLYATLYDHRPSVLAADLHPEYLSTKLAKERAAADSLPLLEVQHHHAHIASCLAENAIPLCTPPVLGIALDGLGFGEDGSLWGGEFMLADYRRYTRIGTFKPLPMIGGAQAIREPWRNTYAHLVAALGWAPFAEHFSDLELYAFLAQKPRPILDQMLQKGLNVPLASSCGRLFDAVAAAVGLCRERALFEGQGAIELEMAVDDAVLHNEDESLAYPFAISTLSSTGMACLEPAPMWRALLGDIASQTPVAVMAARFHKGLAAIIGAMVQTLAHTAGVTHGAPFSTVVLSGGCFQNKILLEDVTRRVEACGLTCLSQSKVPSNDGGLALGQAAIAAARQLPVLGGL
ncbi:MAG TPA: carbamoyltransferase HypF [Candidatus Entotheonella sp.]